MSEKQDLRAHIDLLERSGKLHHISRSVNKDTELMPLVRWQFRGLGDWTDRDREEAKWAVEGEHHRTTDRAKQQRHAPTIGTKPDGGE